MFDWILNTPRGFILNSIKFKKLEKALVKFGRDELFSCDSTRND